MLSYTARRLILLVPMAAGMVVVTFSLLLLIPGDPAAVLLGQEASEADIAQLRATLGLDQPWYVRLGRYFAGLLQGDMGRSIFQNQSVSEIVVWSVIDSLPRLAPGAVVVMKSTVPVGTGEKVRAALDARGLTDVGYVSCPEFLAEGTALRDFLEADRVVIGAFDEADADAIEALHERIDAPVARMDVASAEMVKLAANAFLAMRISFINEIANVCELVGADVEAVAHGMGLDSRIGTRYLRAGLGYGGSCYPKDTSFLKLLAGNSGYNFQLVNAVIQVNELQMRRPVAKLQRHLGQLRGKRVALLGLAFKPGTDDLREAPSIVLASRLLAEGAEVVAWDPVADASEILHGVEIARTALEAMRGADAVVVVTEWSELSDLPWEQARTLMRNALVIDGRNHLDPEAMRALGFVYEGVGRAASPFATLPETQERETELQP